MAAAMVTSVIALPTLPSADNFTSVIVADYVAECPVCQKIRHSMNDKFTSIVRTNNVDLDGVTITPPDKYGMCYVYVSATKLVAGYPVPEHSPSMLLSPSSPMVTTMSLLLTLQWIGTSHRVSLVDVHTSNGVEPYCKQVIIFLRALVQDDRVEDSWSEPQNFDSLLTVISTPRHRKALTI